MCGHITFLVSALLISVVAINTDQGIAVTYTVSQFDQVKGATSFACRLRDYAGPTQVRFIVELAGVQAAADPNTVIDARQYLVKRLTAAERIVLRNVHDHGYFRLTADVYADGGNLGRELLERGLAQEKPPVRPLEHDEDGKDFEPFPPFAPFADIVPLRTPSVTRRPSSSVKGPWGLVDLSSIQPDTPFEEALTHISSREPRLPIVVLWNDLERNAFVDRDTPVGIEGVGALPADKALDIVLRAVSAYGTRLQVIPEGGVLTIVSEHASLVRPKTKVYPVADLVSPEAVPYW